MPDSSALTLFPHAEVQRCHPLPCTRLLLLLCNNNNDNDNLLPYLFNLIFIIIILFPQEMNLAKYAIDAWEIFSLSCFDENMIIWKYRKGVLP